MKLKFTILSVLLCLFALGSWAQSENGVLTIEELTLNPGGESDVVIVGFQGPADRLYTACEMEIILPDGLEFELDEGTPQIAMLEESGVYPSTYNKLNKKTTYSHSLTYEMKGEKSLILSLLSTKSEDFLLSEGQLFAFLVKANSYAKPGSDNKILFKTVNFTANIANAEGGVSAKMFSFSDLEAPIEVSTSGTLPVAVSSSVHWSTRVFPFSVAAVPSGLEVYKFNRLATDENKVYLKKQSSIEAYVPYVLYSENGFDKTLTGTVDAAKYQATVTDGLLVGAVEKQTVSEGYVLQNLKEGVKFYNMAGKEFTIPAGKCYLAPTTASAHLSIAFEDETDGINNVNVNDENTIYDLSGRKLQNATQRGIYIVNGKKVVK